MRFASLASRNFKEIYRDPLTLLLGIFLPVGLLVLFSSIKTTVILDIFKPQNLTPGIAIFSFSFVIMFSAVLIAKDKQTSFLVRLFTTPLKHYDFILAYFIPFIPFVLIQILVCIVVGVILGALFSNIIAAVLFFLIIAFICINIGIILGSLFSLNQVSGIGSVLITVTSLFSGAWMDLKAIGGVFETIGYLLPFAHSVDIVRTILNGGSFTSISNSFFVVFVYFVVLLLFAIFAFNKVLKNNR